MKIIFINLNLAHSRKETAIFRQYYKKHWSCFSIKGKAAKSKMK